MSETNIQHVGIFCADIKKSAAFYKDVFGFENYAERMAPAAHILKFFGVDSPALIVHVGVPMGTTIELFELTALKDKSPWMGNLTHFSLSVKNHEQLIEEIKSKGIAVVSAQKPDGGNVYFIKDPDGVLIEIKELLV